MNSDANAKIQQLLAEVLKDELAPLTVEQLLERSSLVSPQRTPMIAARRGPAFRALVGAAAAVAIVGGVAVAVALRPRGEQSITATGDLPSSTATSVATSAPLTSPLPPSSTPDSGTLASNPTESNPPPDESLALELLGTLGVNRVLTSTRAGDGWSVGVAERTPAGITDSAFEVTWGRPWSDGVFVTAANEPGWMAWTLDGTLVCDLTTLAPGSAWEYLVQRPDGGYTAAMVDWSKAEPVSSPYGSVAHPTDAVDCATGERQPIEPLVYVPGESEFTRLRMVAGKLFVLRFDAEGNAKAQNERGIDIDGNDYAGNHTFDATAELVAYGDYDGLAGPHLTGELVVRDAADGRELWRTTFEEPIQLFDFAGDRLIVSLASSLNAASAGQEGDARAQEREPGMGMPGRVLALDARTGEVLAEATIEAAILAAD